MSKLVVYFSYSGVTKRVSEELAKKQGAELFELKASVPYTSEDVNWKDQSSRNVIEYNDKTSRPEIEAIPELSQVEEIWVGYPIWWYTHPRVINTFFDRVSLEGKKVHLFATSASTGIENSVKELKETYPQINIVDGVII